MVKTSKFFCFLLRFFPSSIEYVLFLLKNYPVSAKFALNFGFVQKNSKLWYQSKLDNTKLLTNLSIPQRPVWQVVCCLGAVDRFINLEPYHITTCGGRAHIKATMQWYFLSTCIWPFRVKVMPEFRLIPKSHDNHLTPTLPPPSSL